MGWSISLPLHCFHTGSAQICCLQLLGDIRPFKFFWQGMGADSSPTSVAVLGDNLLPSLRNQQAPPRGGGGTKEMAPEGGNSGWNQRAAGTAGMPVSHVHGAVDRNVQWLSVGTHVPRTLAGHVGAS